MLPIMFKNYFMNKGINKYMNKCPCADISASKRRHEQSSRRVHNDKLSLQLVQGEGLGRDGRKFGELTNLPKFSAKRVGVEVRVKIL